MEEGKETRVKLTMETKRQRTIGTNGEEEIDRLSELPDSVLLHMMKFMDAKYAVQTCMLSKRWENIWKCLTTLSFDHLNFRRISNFNKFVSQVLTRRDGSISLLNIRLWPCGSGTTASKIMNRVMKYVVSHNVQQLTIGTTFNLRHKHIFSCPSLTFLEIYNSGPPLELPKSLQLPTLKTLFLANVSFIAGDNGCTEPFSTCNLLNTLVLDHCSLHNDAKTLLISNSNLLNLKLDNTFRATTNNLDTSQHKIVLSTPNLSSLTIKDRLSFSYHQLSSTCNLLFLEEGSIHTSTRNIYSDIIGWLQLLTNVKILTLSLGTLKIILKDLSNLVTMKTQPPCFIRLESLKVKRNPHIKISDKEVNKVVEYLLQNSPLTRVAVTNC